MELVKSQTATGVYIPVRFSCSGGRGGWSTTGCILVNNTQEDTTCSCNHLTAFAILLVCVHVSLYLWEILTILVPMNSFKSHVHRELNEQLKLQAKAATRSAPNVISLKSSFCHYGMLSVTRTHVNVSQWFAEILQSNNLSWWLSWVVAVTMSFCIVKLWNDEAHYTLLLHNMCLCVFLCPNYRICPEM